MGKEQVKDKADKVIGSLCLQQIVGDFTPDSCYFRHQMQNSFEDFGSVKGQMCETFKEVINWGLAEVAGCKMTQEKEPSCEMWRSRDKASIRF